MTTYVDGELHAEYNRILRNRLEEIPVEEWDYINGLKVEEWDYINGPEEKIITSYDDY